MLTAENSVVVLIDVQGKLAQLMSDKETLFANLARVIQGAKILGVPVLWAEQIPEKLGPTIPELADLLADQAPLRKVSFSCAKNQEFMAALEATGRKFVVAIGIEAHVCVCQTVVDLLEDGFAVDVVSDAVGSRIASNKAVGLNRMRDHGARISSTEMLLFEWMETAEHPAFREIQALLK
ncbi:MAG: hydrolase [Gammaproteobacteria bacterium]|nr:MAG: hydrolase [Gammaproteobacteria bacterium]